jgi:DNA repair exonuclease SbcCD ATPase subunit/DNA repair exonuclease SbcCD nuclease subunit
MYKKEMGRDYIIHLADIHIRSGNAQQSRYSEYLSAFNRLFAKINKLDMSRCIIVICGDIFHHKNQIEAPGVNLFNILVMGLVKYGPLYIIRGNHDYRQDLGDDGDLISALCDHLAHPDIHYLRETGAYIVPNSNITFGVTAINDILAKGDASGRKREDIPRFQPIYDKSRINVALYHGSLDDTTIDWISREGYNYALLGDIHKRGIYNSGNMKWGYSGSLIQQNFGENVDNHGFLLWDISGDNVTAYNIRSDSIFMYIADNMVKNCDTDISVADYITKYKPKKICASILSGEYKSELKTICGQHEIELVINNGANDTITRTVMDSDKWRDYNRVDTWLEYLSQSGLDADSIGLVKNPENLIIADIPNSLAEKQKKLIKQIANYSASLIESGRDQTVRKLSFKYISWNWLLCYAADNWFNFDNCRGNVTLLNAPNGHGKTGFLEIICLALFGESLPMRSNRGLSSSIICLQKPDKHGSSVTIRFTINDGCEYTLTRNFYYHSNDRDKLQSRNIVLSRNSDQLHTGVTAVNRWIADNIGKIDDFLQSAMIIQGDNADFFTLKMNDQISMLDKTMSLSSINALKDVYKQASSLYSAAIDTGDIVINTLESRINADVYQELPDELKDMIYNISAKIEEYGDIIIPQQYKTGIINKGELEERLRRMNIRDIDIEYSYKIRDEYDEFYKRYGKYIGELLEIYDGSGENRGYPEQMIDIPRYIQAIKRMKGIIITDELERISKSPDLPDIVSEKERATMKVRGYQSITQKELDEIRNIMDDTENRRKNRNRLKEMRINAARYYAAMDIIRRVEARNLPYNPNCHACNSQDWRVEYNNAQDIISGCDVVTMTLAEIDENINREDKWLAKYDTPYYRREYDDKVMIMKLQDIARDYKLYKDAMTYAEFAPIIAEYSDTIAEIVGYYRYISPLYKRALEDIQYLRNNEEARELKDLIAIADRVNNWHRREKLLSDKRALEIKLARVSDQLRDNNAIYGEIRAYRAKISDYKNIAARIERVMQLFDNYRSWLLKNKVLPTIRESCNHVISRITDKLRLDFIYYDTDDVPSFAWIIDDGINRPYIEKASGFQRFIVGLSMRIVLANIGLSNLQTRQLFIDEGFTACDEAHLRLVPQFINNLLTLYDSIILVSHLQQVRDNAGLYITIKRDKNNLSNISYGEKI